METVPLRKIVFTLARLFLIVTAVFFALAWGFLYYLDHVVHDGHMHFSMTSRGAFVERPHVVGSGDERAVRWVMPSKCAVQGYEATTSDYVEDKNFAGWWGSQASCAEDGQGQIVCTEFLHEHAQQYLAKGLNVWFYVGNATCMGTDGYAEFPNLVISPES